MPVPMSLAILPDSQTPASIRRSRDGFDRSSLQKSSVDRQSFWHCEVQAATFDKDHWSDVLYLPGLPARVYINTFIGQP